MRRRPVAMKGLDVFYPIVPDAAWLARILPLGVKTVQLRVKDATPEVVTRQIAWRNLERIESAPVIGITGTRRVLVREVVSNVRRCVELRQRQAATGIFTTLVQPVIWLLLFGALFKTVAEIPGFGSDSYIEFLTPGVVVMTAFFTAGWSGMGMIDDYERGILDRFLSSPVKRVSLIAGPLMQSAVVIVIQSVIIVLLAVALGASFQIGRASCRERVL